jgi:CHAD domain-containing protein
MQYHIPAIETPAAGSRRIMTELLDNIGDRLAGQATLSDSNIHEMRKSCKKMRGLLRTLRPGLHAQNFRTLDRRIRGFAAQLAGLRDNRVMLDTLEQLSLHFAPVLHELALVPVHEALSDVARRHPGATAATPDPEGLCTRLAEIRNVAGQTDWERIETATLLAGLADIYRRGRRLLARMEATPDTEHGHRLRRQAKYHYYQLRMLVTWNETELKSVIDSFHRLEDTLGRDHDLAVLDETLGKNPDLCPDAVRRELLHALIESRRVALLSQALRLARQLYHRKPGNYRRRLELTLAQPASA